MMATELLEVLFEPADGTAMKTPMGLPSDDKPGGIYNHDNETLTQCEFNIIDNEDSMIM